jgi:hypothetical protein
MATTNGLKRYLRDADLLETKALPAAASTSINTDPIDTGVRTARACPADNLGVCLTVPALSAVIIPDTRTMTLTIQASDDPAFATSETLRSKTFTSAGGGLAASRIDAQLPEDCPRYVRGVVAFGASTTTGAAFNAELALLASGS